MAAEIAEESCIAPAFRACQTCGGPVGVCLTCGNIHRNAGIYSALARIETILARVEPLIPAMEQAARFLDNPVQRYREAMKGRRSDRHPD